MQVLLRLVALLADHVHPENRSSRESPDKQKEFAHLQGLKRRVLAEEAHLLLNVSSPDAGLDGVVVVFRDDEELARRQAHRGARRRLGAIDVYRLHFAPSERFSGVIAAARARESGSQQRPRSGREAGARSHVHAQNACPRGSLSINPTVPESTM